MRKEFVYSNPIDPETVTTIRDPFITLVDGTYFLTGTTPPYWDGKSEGVRLWKSDDLLHWQDLGFILHRSVASEKSWFRDNWWAPEIHRKNGRFYLTVNCKNDDLKIGLNPLIAVSDSIHGKYRILSAEEPLFSREKYDKGITSNYDGNDANLFTDDDGKTYISVCCWEGIITYEINLENATLMDPGTPIILPSKNGWDTKNEGQFIIKRNGIYYCFYSSFTRSYEVGVAYADSVKGSWIRDERNPIIAPYGVKGLINCGHNSVFRDKNGDYWTAYHTTLEKYPGRHLLSIDPIDFDEDGKIVTPAPTLG